MFLVVFKVDALFDEPMCLFLDFDLEIDFDIALGTNFIAQHYDTALDTKFINPQEWAKENDRTKTSPDAGNSIVDPSEPKGVYLGQVE